MSACYFTIMGVLLYKLFTNEAIRAILDFVRFTGQQCLIYPGIANG